jgi:hypothetical protein
VYILVKGAKVLGSVEQFGVQRRRASAYECCNALFDGGIASTGYTY